MKTRNQTLQEIGIKSFLLVVLFMVIAAGMTSCGPEIDDPDAPTINFTDEVFTAAQLQETTNIKYGAYNQTLTDFIKAEEHPMDDAPLVILVTGGGLTSWTQEDRLKGLGKELAKRGYAFAFVKHRLGTTPNADAFVKSIQDVFTAVRYYKENAEEYGIDPNRIIIGGWSTGAVAALNVTFTTEDEIQTSTNDPISTDVREAVERQGSIYGDLYLNQTNDVAACLAMMGYIWDIEVVNESKTPLMMINHVEAAFIDGTKIIGDIEVSGMRQWGTDRIREKALQVGYTEGVDLVYLRDFYDDGNDNFSPNIRTLTSDNHPAIIEFLENHVQ